MSPYSDILLACPNTKNFSFYKDLGEYYGDDFKYVLASKCAGVIEKIGIQMGLEYHLGGTLAFYLFLNAFLTYSSYARALPSSSRPLLRMPKSAQRCM